MDDVVDKFQYSILCTARKKLGRDLSERESSFITMREGFLALEAINDEVNTLSQSKLIEYLNSEHPNE